MDVFRYSKYYSNSNFIYYSKWSIRSGQVEDDPNHAADHTDAAEERRHGTSLIPQLVILDAREGRCYNESRNPLEYISVVIIE